MPSKKPPPTNPEDYLLKKCAICGTWIKTKTRYCVTCKPAANRERHKNYDETKRKLEEKKFYNSKLWKTLSLSQRKRYPYCQWTHEDGTQCKSTYRLAADHKIPREQGGKDHPSNLQTLCQHHHNIKTGRETGSFIGHALTTVVCGPPGSGKTSYVMARIQPYDIVLDLDRINAAISLYPKHTKPDYIMRCSWEMRDALLAHMKKARDIPRIWIIEGAPSDTRRMYLRDSFQAEVIVLMPTPEQCKERIAKSQDRDQSANWGTWIDDWFSKYKPCSLDIVIQ